MNMDGKQKRPARTLIKISALGVCLILLFAAAVYARGIQDDAIAAAEKQSALEICAAPPLSFAEETENPAPPAVKPAPKGTGLIAYGSDAARRLSPEQEQLLLDYLYLYYESLAALNAADPSPLFAAGARDQALARRTVWQIAVGLRMAQASDLSLDSYTYKLTVTDVTAEENGDLSLSALEDSVQRFRAFPGVDSESFNIRHRFTLTQTVSGWKLNSHMQIDTSNWVALGPLASLLRGGGSDVSGDIEAALDAQRDLIVNAHVLSAAALREQTAPAGSFRWEHDYNREAAVAYAKKWAGSRNVDWPDYSRYGGNCANYTSQSLLAGGIPMDHTGTSQWKWYGATPNSAQSASGRSVSWAGVEGFLGYALSNTGHGLVADAKAPFLTGQLGDLILLGSEEGAWRHIVLISEVVKDADGRTVDYLICSNTMDLRNMPISAYHYSRKQLIRIFGYNN
ncbi:MAG: amidase domain-containing protein [Gracilibacteraceae bacterium]|nr:amidase domain-containing protein [Gracilibacteraceae bacterium]